MKLATCCGLALAVILGISAAHPEEGALVLIDEDGEEVLRLDPDQPSSGLQAIPVGTYVLEVEGFSAFQLLVGSATILEARPHEGAPEETGPMEVGTSTVVIDFDLEPGDQGIREHSIGGAGDQIELQLTAHDLPEIYGWSFELAYDPDQVAFVNNSFTASSFVPDIMVLQRDMGGSIEIGGANFSKETTSGDGDLGSLRFEALEGFTGTHLELTAFKAGQLDTILDMRIEAVATVFAEGGEPPAEPEDHMLDLSGDQALAHLVEHNACPGCDLSGVTLMQRDLQEADLSRADLSGANLFATDLSRASLVGARLVDANMLQTKLHEANLRDADLSDANLMGAKLQNADLTGANLEGARLTGASLTGAIWTDGSECGPGSVGSCR